MDRMLLKLVKMRTAEHPLSASENESVFSIGLAKSCVKGHVVRVLLTGHSRFSLSHYSTAEQTKGPFGQ